MSRAALVLFIALALSACAPRREPGTCVPCNGWSDPYHHGYCVEGACFCPAASTCNYGIPRVPDAGSAPCCIVEDGGLLGVVSSCGCTTGTACGLSFPFVECGDGTCALGDGGACPVDGGAGDAGR